MKAVFLPVLLDIQATVGITANVVAPGLIDTPETRALPNYEALTSMTAVGRAGTPQEDPRYGKPMHNEAVVFNEDVLPTGAALHTLFALRMLAQET